MPKGLVDEWGTHGYYGTKSHDVRAIYNYYLGYFDGNPAHLNPLPPEEVGKKYVQAMGGAQKVLALGHDALEKGEYRWGAELVNHLVFAEPTNQDARDLQADLLEQMGYQSESGPWRNFYLAGAKELRNGLQKLQPNTSSLDVIHLCPLSSFLAMGINWMLKSKWTLQLSRYKAKIYLFETRC
jgi:alkyl sulfatase BDS1-like metallo-beta-lactamase superfamily hydrolase